MVGMGEGSGSGVGVGVGARYEGKVLQQILLLDK